MTVFLPKYIEFKIIGNSKCFNCGIPTIFKIGYPKTTDQRIGLFRDVVLNLSLVGFDSFAYVYMVL